MRGWDGRSNYEETQYFKFTPKWDGVREVKLQDFGLRVSFNNSVPFKQWPKKISLDTVTSEDNAYDEISGTWFDGKTYSDSFGIFTIVSFDFYFRNVKRFRITEFTQYKNLQSTCSHQSYHKCLAKRKFSI